MFEPKQYDIARPTRYSLAEVQKNYLTGRSPINYNVSELIGNKYKLMYKSNH